MVQIIKKEIRILGIDDAPFSKTDKEVMIVGTVFRGSSWLDGLISTKIDVDGDNSTDRIAEMVNRTKHKDQLQVIFLDGIAFGGFNVVDIKELCRKTRIPIVTIMRARPDFPGIASALKNVRNNEQKIARMRNAGKVQELNINDKKVFVQYTGIELDDVVKLLQLTCIRSVIPEPIRVAHLIASGVVTGESRGRA